MKARHSILFLIFYFLVNHLGAQCINGTKSYPIYKKGAQLVNKFDEDGKEIVHIEYDLIFTSKEIFRNLTSDWEYSIIGFADEGVKDLDLKLYEFDELLQKWSLVAEDNSSGAFVTLNYKPSTTALYKVEVIAYSFNEGYSAARYGLMFVHD